MLARRNWILLTVLAALIAADLATRQSSGPSREVGPLLPELTVEAAARLVLDAPDPDGDGRESLVLIRSQDKRHPWRFPDYHDFPARTQAVESWLKLFVGVTTLDQVADREDAHADYGLTLAASERVSVFDAGGELLADVLIGERAPGGNATYVRRIGEAEVYRAPNIRGQRRARPDHWLDSLWMPRERPRVLVRRFELAGSAVGGGPLVLTRSVGSMDVWLDATGERVSSSVVHSLLSSLTSLIVTDVLAAEPETAGLGEPLLEVTLERESGEPWRGRLYLGEGEDERLGTRDDGDWLVRLTTRAVDDAVNAARALAQ